MSDIVGKRRILARLQAGYDVCAVDFQAPTVDGGKPILRVPARILDLKREGWAIDRVGTRNHCAVYRLASAVLDHPGTEVQDDGQIRWEAA